MLDVKVLGITRDIKLKIIENVTVSEIGMCAEHTEEYCNIYQCTDGVLMNDLLTLNIMYRFSNYMNMYTFEWMPISNIDFRAHLEREFNNIYDKIRGMCTIEFCIG